MASDFPTFAANFAAGISGLDPSGLTPETRFRELEEWDSLAVLATLAMLDSDYGVTATATDLRSCQTLADIQSLAARLARG